MGITKFDTVLWNVTPISQSKTQLRDMANKHILLSAPFGSWGQILMVTRLPLYSICYKTGPGENCCFSVSGVCEKTIVIKALDFKVNKYASHGVKYSVIVDV
jgi:hypothetical protein